jgi:enterochelin esterase family protein
MGGNHTLQVAIPRLDRFGYIGVYSSGLLGAFPNVKPAGRGGPPAGAPAPAAAPRPMTIDEWEAAHGKTLNNAAMKKGLKLFWFATGKDDFLLSTTVATVDMFKKHGFTPVFKETPGGHTWLNWRAYLVEFAPQLFR